MCGLLNGVLITRLKLPPFIVTLGTWSIFAALVTLVSEAATIRKVDLEMSAPFLLEMGSPYFARGRAGGTPPAGRSSCTAR